MVFFCYIFNFYIPLRVILTSALSEVPRVHQQTHDADISPDNMEDANRGPDITVDNQGRAQTKTSGKQYQALLQDPHEYEYPNLAEITRRNTDISMPRNTPAQSHADNAREYLELIDDSNDQQNIAMTTVLSMMMSPVLVVKYSQMMTWCLLTTRRISQQILCSMKTSKDLISSLTMSTKFKKKKKKTRNSNLG